MHEIYVFAFLDFSEHRVAILFEFQVVPSHVRHLFLYVQVPYAAFYEPEPFTLAVFVAFFVKQLHAQAYA